MTDDPVRDQLPDDMLALLNSAGLMQFLEGALHEVRFQRSYFPITYNLQQHMMNEPSIQWLCQRPRDGTKPV